MRSRSEEGPKGGFEVRRHRTTHNFLRYCFSDSALPARKLLRAKFFLVDYRRSFKRGGAR